MKLHFHFSNRVYIGILFLMMLSRNNLNAQCYIACTGSCENVPSYPSYSITSSATWSGSHRYCMGDNDLTISGVGTILTITGPCIEFDYATPREIVIDSGATLIIEGGTNIYAADTKRWKGIRIRSGGKLIIDGATAPYNAIIANATNGVLAENNSATESVFNITGASFCNNLVGIRIQPLTGTMISTVVGSRFTAPALSGARKGLFNTGIYVNQVKPTDHFLIGDGLQYHDGLENEFEDLNVAIKTYKSDVIVADNFIHDVKTAISATASLSAPGYLQVGQVFDPTDPHQIYNVIENAVHGIVVNNNVSTNIYENSITSDFNVGSGTYKMDRGIEITNNCPHLFINNVFVEGFNEYGVYIDNIPAADSIYINQSSILEPNHFSESLTPTGIWMSDAAATVFIIVNGNAITNVLTGIELLNVTHPQLYYNQSIYEAMTDIGGVYNAYGIKLTNCEDALVSSNICTGNYVPGFEDVVRGIYLEACINFEVTGNSITAAGEGIYIYNTSTEGVFTCNMMNNCNYGIYLLDIGGDAITSPIHSDLADDPPTENHWFPEASANRITTEEDGYVTNCEMTNWNYWNDPAQYDIPLAQVVPFGTSTPPNFILTARDGEPCSAYGEKLMFVDEYEAFVTELENVFGTWAIAFNDEKVEDVSGSWFMQYLFWNKMLKNNIKEKDLSQPLRDLYNAISVSNIPFFDALVDANSDMNYATADDILNNISPMNDLEYYWKLTSQLYVNNIDSTGIFDWSEEEEQMLSGIAVLNGAVYGPGVYYAWGMLDTTIEHNKYIEEESMLKEIPQYITLAPNPTQLYITILCNDCDYLINNLENIEVYSLTGNKVKLYSEIKSMTLNVGDLSNGMYIFKLIFADNTNSISKVIINK